MEPGTVAVGQVWVLHELSRLTAGWPAGDVLLVSEVDVENSWLPWPVEVTNVRTGYTVRLSPSELRQIATIQPGTPDNET